MKHIYKLQIVISSVFFLISPLPVFATIINFNAEIGFIEYDTGSSIFSGVSLGDVFAGSFNYGDSASDATTVYHNAPTGTDYSFNGNPYGGYISDGSKITTGINSKVGIGDNDGMGDDTIFINNLYGTSIPYGAISDTWGVSSSNGIQSFGIDLYSFETSLYSSTDFLPYPPALDDADISLFYIEETDSSGNSIYLATGILSSVTAVPAPPALWLFGTGLIGLLGVFRYKKPHNNQLHRT